MIFSQKTTFLNLLQDALANNMVGFVTTYKDFIKIINLGSWFVRWCSENNFLLFVIDISGSMQPYINALANALSLYASDFGSTDHKFGLVVFPGMISYGAWNELSVRSGTSGNAFVDVGTFQGIIGSLAANGGAYEPSYDVAHILMNPTDPRNIGWRSDAYPYIILISKKF